MRQLLALTLAFALFGAACGGSDGGDSGGDGGLVGEAGGAILANEVVNTTLGGAAAEHDGISLALSNPRFVEADDAIVLTLDFTAANTTSAAASAPKLFLVCNASGSGPAAQFDAGQSPFAFDSENMLRLDLQPGEERSGATFVAFPATLDLAPTCGDGAYIDARFGSSLGGFSLVVDTDLDAAVFPLDQATIDEYNTMIG